MRELAWLGIVRHGQSIGNIAAERAERGNAEVIDLAERDADVPLSPTGEHQAQAVGRLLAAQPPDLVIASPYLRTRQTAGIALTGLDVPLLVDERLRDRELGVLDLLTNAGVRARFPEEERRRARLGKFYYRPPGGESWADVLLRLRSVLRELREDHAGARVLLVAHEATVWLVRYLVEGLAEPELMSLARGQAIANCSISAWRDGTAERFNDVGHLAEHGAPATEQEEVRAEPA
ncbi:phosphoglycerate mutase [Actinoplanes sp. SE50]|uniref:histidine phosphatase family protein n=1 Tax=unclassified Actinoplanes TaxID=2626549 RepID=UPI00023ED09A|nr:MULTISPECIES: histidine phosphatase family protein [unclassified Actinoplanes]AEV84924.1 Phosphoglycerate mutase [Actinoplanes sp. SE50/110]ATO83315.1 phosphoglycerate mutase [Actinoplanes sp. SE50]SLM00722.1 phosphoglycerate mutase [Actinoplanes sp. SE50/110]